MKGKGKTKVHLVFNQSNAELPNGFLISIGANVNSFDTNLDFQELKQLMHPYGCLQPH